MLYETADVLTGNSHIHNPYINPGLIASFFNCLFNCKNSFINIEYNSFHNAFRFGFTHPENFQFSKLVFASDDSTNFCRANVKSYYNFFLFHGCNAL